MPSDLSMIAKAEGWDDWIFFMLLSDLNLKLQLNIFFVKSGFADLSGPVISERIKLFYKRALPFAPELFSFFIIAYRIDIRILAKLSYKVSYHL